MQTKNAKLHLDLIDRLPRRKLRDLWLEKFGEKAPTSFGRELLALAIAHARQERHYGTHPKSFERDLNRFFERSLYEPTKIESISPLTRPGTVLVREWQGVTHHVTVVADGYLWDGRPHRSLSKIALAITGTKWNGPRFFGLRETSDAA